MDPLETFVRPICSVFIAASLDGFIARADGSLDWLSSVQQPDEDYGYKEFADSIDTLVIGRNTYDLALGFDAWPYAGKRCVVLTHRPCEASHHEEFFAGELRALLARLAREGSRRVYVDGGRVIQRFLAEGLLTDLTLSVIPVLLGQGIPLFGPDGCSHKPRLLGAQTFVSGLVQLRYSFDAQASTSAADG
jgi:dihydrofolate reductase